MGKGTVTGILRKYLHRLTRARVLYPIALIALLFSVLLPASVHSANIPVKIGVTANRGPKEALKKWSPVADYLTASIPGYNFKIIPYDLPCLDNAVKSRKVDFIITNPGSYVELESLYGVKILATMVPLENGGSLPVFGAVIFTRTDRKDIKQLYDLKGKSFMAVDELAFGGWQMAWREFKEQGIDPYSHIINLSFSGFPQDKVVYAVRDGKVDAGTVRTGLLESMSREGLIDIGTFRVLNPQHNNNFPFLNSTRLYPEWPIAKVAHTPDELAKKVSMSLLAMPSDSPAAKGAKIAGWTIPPDYNNVHECLRVLRVGPYQDYGGITPYGVLKKYWYIVLLLFVGLSLMWATTFYFMKLNRNLRESQERYRSLFVNSLDGVLFASEDGAVLAANRTACVLLGYTDDEILKIRREDIVDITEPRFKKFLEERYCAGSARGEITMVRKNGSRLDVDISSSVFRDAKSIPISSIVFHDITEKKELERQRADFYAMVTHDIKTPLTTIMGYGSMLAEMADRLDTDANSMVESIINNCYKLRTLFDDFLAISSLESGKFPLKYFTCEISQLLKESVAGLDKAIQKKGLILNMETAECQPPRVTIDPKLVQRAVSNLLQNAVNYTPSGGIISISLESVKWDDTDFVTISVADNGRGIPLEEQDKIFEKYYRSPGTNDIKGTGLGLFIVKTVAKAHNGRVELTSEVGKGSTFKIILPSAPSLTQ